jgi:hypothetical protein
VTVALALILLGLLLIYTGVKGRSLQSAVLGRSQPGGFGSVVTPA